MQCAAIDENDDVRSVSLVAASHKLLTASTGHPQQVAAKYMPGGNALYDYCHGKPCTSWRRLCTAAGAHWATVGTQSGAEIYQDLNPVIARSQRFCTQV